MKKFLACFLSFVLIVSAIPVFAEGELSDDIVILYTNDIHTYIDKEISYDVVAAIKSDLQTKYKYVILADAGDHIQGTAYGSVDNGKTVIDMMNVACYDVATLGNHEFDYGMQGCLDAVSNAEFPYISANFYHEENGVRGKNVLDSYVMFDCGDETLAMVGITTPETFSKSTPKYFQDENGNYIYGISGGENGEDLIFDVQAAIDDAKKDGATKVIALGHLGIDPSSKPWTSEEVISAVSGLDAFIDGHSHSVVMGENVSDKDGNDVLLTQTGSYFDRLGIMVIDSKTGEINTDFIQCEETADGYKLSSKIYNGTDLISYSAVAKIKDAWINEISEKLNTKIGTSSVVLDNYDADGNRLVRSEETNSGDFAADALYYLFDNMGLDVDVAFMNGGGIRNAATTGDITYKTCKDYHTFGNIACLQTVTGQQILDALEWGARMVGSVENGGFLQASGITYKIYTSFESVVKEDEMGTWIAPPEKYRVYDVAVYDKESDSYMPLDLNAKYNLAGYNYTLRNLGDGYAMFDGAVNVLDYVMEDYMVLANYVCGFENGVINATNSPLLNKYPGMLIDYGTVYGSGRIEIAENSLNFADVNATDWYYDDVKFAYENNLLNGTDNNMFEPESNLTRAMLVTVLYRAAGQPEVSGTVPFADVDSKEYYKNAVNWAYNNGIVTGVTDNAFAPNNDVTREQIAAIMFRYASYSGIDTTVGGMQIREYSDYDMIEGYALNSLGWAVNCGLMRGKSAETIAPKDNATRAEAAAIFRRFDNMTK